VAVVGRNAATHRNQGSLSGRARGSINRSDRGAQSDNQRNRSNRFRARAEARDKRGISRPQGRATRPTARLADWHQGPPRDRRAADNLWLAPLSRPRARTRCGQRACDDEHAFDFIVVHSYSRFFREAFEQEFYLRKLAKHGVRVVSITQPVGDETEPVHAMMRKVIALFDEYQSKENAKHVIRSMKENA